MITLRETRKILREMSGRSEFSEYAEALENGAKYIPHIEKVQGKYQSLRFMVPLCPECANSCKRKLMFECAEFKKA